MSKIYGLIFFLVSSLGWANTPSQSQIMEELTFVHKEVDKICQDKTDPKECKKKVIDCIKEHSEQFPIHATEQLEKCKPE